MHPKVGSGEISVQRGDTDVDLLVHFDKPLGEPRWTYASLKNDQVSAIAIVSPAQPYEGEHCFQLGCAVPQHFRKRGYAKSIVKSALDELTAGLSRNGVSTFYVEAIVGKANVASQHVAESVFGTPVKEGQDKESAEPIFQYILKVG